MRRWLVAVVVGLLPTLAEAAGWYIGDIGAQAMGQGGAFVASPTDLTAFWYNPAALSAGEGHSLAAQLEVDWHYTPMTFTRAAEGSTTFAPVPNRAPHGPAGFAGVTYDFSTLGAHGLVVGLAVYTPTAGNYDYSESGSQRFLAVRGSTTMFFAHLGVAYQLFDWLSLGATFGPAYFYSDRALTVSAAPAGDPENEAFAVPVGVRVTDPFTFTANFGIRVTPLHGLALGVSLMPPFRVDAEGKLTAKLPPVLSAVELNGDRATLGLNFPLIARAGAQYQILDQLSVDVAFVYEAWSMSRIVQFQPKLTLSLAALGLDRVGIPRIDLNNEFHDTYSFRFGVTGTPLSFLTLRAGLMFESAADPARHFELGNPEAQKWFLTAGVTARWWMFALDVGFAHAIVPVVNLQQSTQVLSSAFPGANTSKTIGNGRFVWGIDMLHTAVRFNY